MKIIKSIIPVLLLLAVYSCAEEVLKPINDDDRMPGLISNIEVENLSGAVKLSYDLPVGTSLLYVEAEVNMGNGRVVKKNSSFYQNTLMIEGFGQAKEYEVSLYSVGRNLKKSEPITIKVNPLEPPVNKIFQSLEILEDFGGMSISFVNETEAEVSIAVDMLNPEGEWNTIETFYTKQQSGTLAVRGLEAVASTFRIYVNDRWGNKSDVLETQLTPIFEQEMDYSKFIAMSLANDPEPFGANRIPFLWNNNLSGTASGSGGWYRTANGTPMPTQITIDMGVTAKLSRFKFWQRGSVAEHNLLYSGGSPKEMEIWGSNAPNPDGTYDSWVKLMDIELVKPSGLPMGNNSPEDIEVAERGHEYTFPIEAPAVKYLRIRVKKTFGVTDYFWMSEMDIFGQPL